MSIRRFRTRHLLLFWTFLAGLATIPGAAAPSHAHPHVWVDYAIEARFDQDGLTGFQHRWLFDDMFSSQIMEMFDADGDGVFSPEEIVEVRRGAFEYLQEYDYFIQIKIDGMEFIVQYVRDFHASIEGHLVAYEFFVPCTVTAAADWKTIDMLIADMEYFVEMAFLRPELAMKKDEKVEFAQSFGKSEAFSFWGGAWIPEHFTLRFRKAP